MDTSQYLSLYPAAFAEYEATTYVFDSAAIQQLYSAVDFIGISSYTSLAPNFTINQIEGATYQYAQEIQSFGVDLSSLIFDQVGPQPLLRWLLPAGAHAPSAPLSEVGTSCSAMLQPEP